MAAPGPLTLQKSAMFRIHIVDWIVRDRYADHLERYFRIRHEVYVEKRRWGAIARPIGMEIDAFDTRDAIYLLGIDERSNIVSGARLVPTLKPHLLADVFPVLAPGGVPRAADIFEWTRFFVVPELAETGRSSKAAGVVLCGLLEACLTLRISKLSVVCEAFWPERLQALGWEIAVLGDVLNHPDGDIVGLLIDVTDEALASTRKIYRIEGPVLLTQLPDRMPQRSSAPGAIRVSDGK
jgi:acyl-homoserine lactone synthase